MKRFVCGVALVLALGAVLFAGRKEIDDVYKAYEAFVAEAENLAKRPSVAVTDFSVLSEKAEVMQEKGEAVRDDRDWTPQDVKRFAALDERFQKAWGTIMQKLKY